MLRQALGTNDHPADRVGWSLSHTQGLVCVGVAEADDVAVGVDVEPLAAADRLREMSELFVSERESRWLAEQPQTADQRLVELWTLKEATLKAGGVGIADAGGFAALRALECTYEGMDGPWSSVRVRDAAKHAEARAWVCHVGAFAVSVAAIGGSDATPRLEHVSFQRRPGHVAPPSSDR